MANWRPNRNQWLTIWLAGIMGLLSLAAGMWLMGGLLLGIGGVLVWRLDSRGRKPENAVVKSAVCRHCGHINEPHWARCAKCNEADWKG